ncbi:hypothetical protein TYRP_020035 [Tyrophagus putrescentiae]|nr:hypothetical protein TYRP_020035 [Tyrophagus putrescentiae]
MTTSADTSSSSPLLSMASQQRAPATSVVATVVVTSASQTIEIPATPKANFSRSLVNCRKSDAGVLVMPSFGTNQSTIDLAPSSHLGIGNTSMCGNGRVGGNASSTGSSSSSILAYNQTPQQFQLQPLFPSVEPLQAPLTASSNLSTIANLNWAASTSKVLFPTTTKSVGIPPLAPPDPVFQRPISGTPNIGNLPSTPSTSASAQKQGPPVDSPIKSVCRFCGQFSSEGKSFEEFLKHLESKHPGEYIMPLRGSGLKWLCPIAGCRRKYERDEETAKWTFIYRNHLVSHMQTHHGTFKPVRIKKSPHAAHCHRT